MKRIQFFALTAAVCLFASCASIQKDLSVAPEDAFGGEVVQEIEMSLIETDGRLYGGQTLSQKDESVLKSVIAEIDRNLSVPLLEKTVEARLYAMKGRAQILLGDRVNAKKNYSEASKRYSNDVQCIILGRRLGEVAVYSSVRYKNDSALLIEAALENYDEGNYEIACGLFDEAFLKSNNFYRDAYTGLRNKSWNLRNIDPASASTYMTSDTMTVLQMVEITQQKSALLDYYTGGKMMTSRQLYTFLEKAGLMEGRSTVDSDNQITGTENVIKETSLVNRVFAARYLWNIYTSNKAVDPNRYSKRYRARQNPRSPVSDVDVYSVDFDAVLGVIENDIMTLVDGKNFNPLDDFSPAQFSEALSRVE